MCPIVTNSLTYETETNDINENFHKFKDEFDLSNYPKQNGSLKKTQKGNWWKKDKAEDFPTVEIVGLEPKM